MADDHKCNRYLLIGSKGQIKAQSKVTSFESSSPYPVAKLLLLPGARGPRLSSSHGHHVPDLYVAFADDRAFKIARPAPDPRHHLLNRSVNPSRSQPTLPYDPHSPPLLLQGNLHLLVAHQISLKLCFPELRACGGCAAPVTAGMAVPEAAVNENRNPARRQNDVGPS